LDADTHPDGVPAALTLEMMPRLFSRLGGQNRQFVTKVTPSTNCVLAGIGGLQEEGSYPDLTKATEGRWRREPDYWWRRTKADYAVKLRHP
jgi:hypothetical protein